MARITPLTQPWRALALSLIACAIAISDIHAQAGTSVEVSVFSPALKANRVGESPTRHVWIYLPAGYKSTTSRRYPTMYFLHGFQDSYKNWSALFPVLDSLIKAKAIREMIVVIPDGGTRYGGSFYTNSSTTGNWEDFIAADLVSYVDSHYRTVRQASSRGLAGHSMGGYAALKLGMKHPDVFGAVYGMSPCCLGWGGDLSPENPAWNTTLGFKSFDDLKPNDGIFFAQVFMALSAAWSPGNVAPLYADPLVRKGGSRLVVSESIRAKWSANMPLFMVDQYRSNLSQLRGIAFDVGAQDQFTHIPITARAISRSLKDNGIPHTFEEYQGDHTSRLRERVIEHMLPFFFQSTRNAIATFSSPVSRAVVVARSRQQR